MVDFYGSILGNVFIVIRQLRLSKTPITTFASTGISCKKTGVGWRVMDTGVSIILEMLKNRQKILAFFNRCQPTHPVCTLHFDSNIDIWVFCSRAFNVSLEKKIQGSL